MKKYLLFFTLALLVTSAKSQLTRSFSNEFLNIGVDARAFGMGNAVVANTGDVTSGYWNPAGLAYIDQDWQAAAMHAEYFQSIAAFDYAAFAIPLENNNTIAVSLFRFGVDDILNTTELIDQDGVIDYDRISTFTAADYALFLSYGGFLFGGNKLSFGANAKLIYRHVGKFANSIGFGFDVGMQYRSEKGFSLGIVARDVTTTFNAWSVNEDELQEIIVNNPETGEDVILNRAPEESIELTLPKLQIGVAQKVDIGDRFGVLGEMDLNFRFTETNDLVSTSALSMSPSAGIEGSYNDLVFLRLGVNNFQFETEFDNQESLTFQPNFGLGFKYKGLSIDYSLTDIGDQSISLYSNIFSVKLDIGGFR